MLGEVLGRKAYPSLSDIPEAVDLVALVIPPEHSPVVLRQAASIGAGAAFMVSGGFGETGERGRVLQDEVAAICHSGGIRLLGPNTSGFIRPSRGLNLTFLPAMAEIPPGPVGVVAQSGGINITLAYLAHHQDLGISLAVGLGNAADVGLADVIDDLADDPETKVIAIHLEGVTDGRRLYDSLVRACVRKPVCALPVGRSDLGDFAKSHTGNLIGSFVLTRSALTQAGAVVVDDLGELVDAAHALSQIRLPPKRAPGVGILTSQAGPGLLMTDILNSAAVAVPPLAPATVKRIADLLPPMTYMENPIDTGRPGEGYAEVLAVLADDSAIDAVLIYALLEVSIDAQAAIQAAQARSPVPMIFGTCGTPGELAADAHGIEQLGIPTFSAPDRAARAMRALVADARAHWRQKGRIIGTVAAPSLGPDNLDEHAAKGFIERAGIPAPRRIVCRTHSDAHDARRAIDGPIVIKLLDRTITHKTEVGGVHLGIGSPRQLDAALRAIDAIPSAGSTKYLVEEMAPPGLELIIGATNDQSFGPTVLLGLGGTAAEVLGDVTMRLAPLSIDDAYDMIDGLRGRQLFDGWRGSPAIDRGSVAEAVVAVGDLIAAHPEIKELDLNPLRAYPAGVLALDALVVL